MINGVLLRDAIVSASNNINNYRKEVDALNVFPVPDGDTGTNMSMTITAAAREVALVNPNATVSSVADTIASALLRGARGNSGVILSLIFRGFAKGLKGHKTADGATIARALNYGAESAYKAVMKPTEGTMLTVVRISGEKATLAANDGADAFEVWKVACNAATEALADTPNLLPVLKKSGVVDAGGQGLLYIFEGMKSVFIDNTIINGDNVTAEKQPAPKSIVAQASGDIKFGYCTEFLVDRPKNTDLNPIRLRAYLESIGDSVVVVNDDDIIKVHLHTNEPGNVLQEALKYGPLINIKIDNMRQQHTDTQWGDNEDEGSEHSHHTSPVEPINTYGFVAVCAGDGLKELFTELGVDNVVNGGQTMNPSTDDILQAVQATPAKHVFVLPNNKNIIMAAEQVIPLADRKVSVLQTRTIPEGVIAMLSFDETHSADENHLNMMKSAEKVSTGLVTFAARNSTVNNQPVNKGQILGMENGKITVVDSDPVSAAYRIIRHMFKKHSSMITIFFGEDTTQEQADILQSMLEQKFGSDAEISIINGGQPVYYFIISVE